MKKYAFIVLSAAVLAAPAAAQSRNDGPWWDPARTGTRTGSGRVDTHDGRIHNDGRIYDRGRADGQWRREGRDRSGNIIYVRTRYDRSGNLIRERARRDTIGRYRVVDRRVIQSRNRRHDDRIYRDRNGDGWEDSRDRNDRWEQNDGHDNGKHTGWYKDKNKNKNKNKGKGRG